MTTTKTAPPQMADTQNNDVLHNLSMLFGTPDDVRTKLAQMKGQSIVAFAGSENDVSEAVNVMKMISTVKMQRQQDAYKALIEALVSPAPLPLHKFVEAKMTARARNAVFESSEWLTAVQFAEIAGLSKKNPSAQPNKWKQAGAIFAVNRNGIDYFPGYALDPDANYRPYKALADVLKIFNNKKDAWGLAYWFSSVNSFLGGLRPQDLLANEPDKVIAAAEDEVADLAGVAHG